MNETNTGGPAFPTKNYTEIVPLSTGYSEGMTLRDYIAVRVLRMYSDDTDEMLLENAVRAYKQADAMLKARNA